MAEEAARGQQLKRFSRGKWENNEGMGIGLLCVFLTSRDRGKPRVFNKNTSTRRGGFLVFNVGAVIGATRG